MDYQFKFEFHSDKTPSSLLVALEQLALEFFHECGSTASYEPRPELPTVEVVDSCSVKALYSKRFQYEELIDEVI